MHWYRQMFSAMSFGWHFLYSGIVKCLQLCLKVYIFVLASSNICSYIFWLIFLYWHCQMFATMSYCWYFLYWNRQMFAAISFGWHFLYSGIIKCLQLCLIMLIFFALVSSNVCSYVLWLIFFCTGIVNSNVWSYVLVDIVLYCICFCLMSFTIQNCWCNILIYILHLILLLYSLFIVEGGIWGNPDATSWFTFYI